MITHKQRVQAALEGKILDRPAFAAWGPHLNLEDRNVKDFTRATINYQNVYDFDFIKVMPNGMYFPEAFGQKLRDAEHILDMTCKNTTKYVINDAHDWLKIKKPSMKTGVFAREIEVVKRLADYYQGDVPILPTVFSSLVWMGEMSGGFSRQDMIATHFSESESMAKVGLEIVSETNQQLMEEFIKAGADGFFLGYQGGIVEKMGKDHFEEYGKKIDIMEINRIKDKTWFNMAHACHTNRDTLELFLEYPVEAINWADQHKENYSMGEIREKTDKVLVGGLDHAKGENEGDINLMLKIETDLSGTNREEIKKRIKNKVYSALHASGNKTIISGGCLWSIGALPRFPLWKEVMEEIGQEINNGKEII